MRRRRPGAAWAVESQMTRAVREIAALFEHRLFLSATPHNGHSNSFATLLEILDPQRFTRGIDVEAKELEPIMVRRLKEDLRRLGHAFPERIVEPIRIDGLPPDAPELRLAAMLDDYRQSAAGGSAGALPVREPATAPLLLDRCFPSDADDPSEELC